MDAGGQLELNAAQRLGLQVFSEILESAGRASLVVSLTGGLVGAMLAR